MEIKQVSLSNLGKGAAAELFAEEFTKVLENIADVNTPAKSMREVSITVRIYPNEARDYATLEIVPSSKLAKTKAFESRMHIGVIAGKVLASEEEIKQPELITDNIRDIGKGRQA